MDLRRPRPPRISAKPRPTSSCFRFPTAISAAFACGVAFRASDVAEPASGQSAPPRPSALGRSLHPEHAVGSARHSDSGLLGGVEYWRYGVEQVSALAAAKGIALAIVPGDGRPDPRLDAASNLPPSTLRRLKTLCDSGGPDSARAALAQLALAAGLPCVPPVHRAALQRHGFYVPGTGVVEPNDLDLAADGAPIVLVVFYRAFLAASDTDPVDRLIGELARCGTRAIGLFAASLKDRKGDGWLRHWITGIAPDLIINATAFSARGDGNAGSPLDVVDAPVLQVALAGSTREVWTDSDRGLSPSDLTIHVVLPELDAASSLAWPRSSRSKRPIPTSVTPARFIAAMMDASPPLSPAPAPGSRCGEPRMPTSASPSCYRPIRGGDDQMAHAVGLDAPESSVEVLNVLRDRGLRHRQRSGRRRRADRIA